LNGPTTKPLAAEQVCLLSCIALPARDGFFLGLGSRHTTISPLGEPCFLLRWERPNLREILVSFRLKLLREFVGLVIGLPLLLLVPWQAFVVGIKDGGGVCLLLCGLGILSFFLLMAAHEMGHLLAGRAMSLPFVSLTLGPLQVVREGERIRVRLNTAWFQPAFYVKLGVGAQGNWRLRWAVMVLGGPLTNLLIGVACLLAAGWLNPGPSSSLPASARTGLRMVALVVPGNFPTALLNIVGLLSLGFGLGNFIPAHVVGFRTDGGQLLDLWRGSWAPRQMPQIPEPESWLAHGSTSTFPPGN
jgi:hypothetical protein